MYRARDTADDEIVALKKVRMEKERDGIPVSSIREISLLFSLKHENIVDLRVSQLSSFLPFIVTYYRQSQLDNNWKVYSSSWDTVNTIWDRYSTTCPSRF